MPPKEKKRLAKLWSESRGLREMVRKMNMEVNHETEFFAEMIGVQLRREGYEVKKMRTETSWASLRMPWLN